MTRPTLPVRASRGELRLVRRLSLPASLGLLALAVAAAPVAAGPGIIAKIKNNTLTVTGTSGADVIVLRLSATDPNVLEVDAGGDGTADIRVARSRFDEIEVEAGGGSDTIRIDNTGGIFTDTEVTHLNGEVGPDTIIGGAGPEILIGGPDGDLLDGNQGLDTVLGGGGDDVVAWDPGDASDTIEGGTGADRLAFNGANVGELFAATANGGRVTFTRNIGNVSLDLDDVERLDLRALGGEDLVTVNDLSGTDLALVRVDLAASTGGGDGAADTVTVRGTAGSDTIGVDAANGDVTVAGLASTVRISGEETIDTLAIAGLTADDVLTVDPAVQGLIQVITTP